MATIKPFRPDREWFRIHNYTFDACMPALSNAGWRVLCVAIRKTLGWHSEITDSGRKEWDQISYSQFLEASGLKSRSSISAGIKENLEAGYLLRRRIGTHQGTGAPVYAYALNLDFEVEVPDFAGTVSVLANDDHKIAGPESVPAASTENGPAASTESVLTKEKEKEKEREKGLSSFDWFSVLRILSLQMTKGTYDAHLLGSRAERRDGHLTVYVRSTLSIDWLDTRLRPTIERAIENTVGEPLAVRFEVMA